LDPSTRDINGRTEWSPASIPFLIDDALEDARHAECHWSPLVTPQYMGVEVEATAYQQTPATDYAKAAFAKTVGDDPLLNLEYESAPFGSAACIGALGQTYYGVLRKDNVVMAVAVSGASPVPTQWRENMSTTPVYALLSVLNEQFGGGTGEDDEDYNCWLL